MSVTAAGNPYNVTTVTLPSGQVANIGAPVGGAARFVLYTHGANGGPDQFSSSSGPWPQSLRNWLIDNRIGWIEGTGGGAQPWGNAASQTAYEELAAYADGLYAITHWIVLGRSMGGVVAARLYLAKRAADSRFVGLIVNSGVQDLVWAYDTGTWTAEMNGAWGVSNRSGFVTAINGRNPIAGPASAWAGARVLQLWGTSDTTVPSGANGEAMRAMYAGQPTLDRVDIRPGGDHSAGNGSYLQVSAMTSFIAAVIPGGNNMVAGITTRTNGVTELTNLLPLRATTIASLFSASGVLTTAADGTLEKNWIPLGTDGDWRAANGVARPYAQPATATLYGIGLRLPQYSLDYRLTAVMGTKGGISATQAGVGIFVAYISETSHLRLVDGGAGIGWRLQYVQPGSTTEIARVGLTSANGDTVIARIDGPEITIKITPASGDSVTIVVAMPTEFYQAWTAADEAGTPVYVGMRAPRQGTNASATFDSLLWEQTAA